MQPAQVDRLLHHIGTRFQLAVDAEITLECNPGDADLGKLRGFRDAGANRLSFGVQSLDDSVLPVLGRRHSSADVVQSFRSAREAGFDNVSLDFMFGLPSQSVSHWVSTLDQAVLLEPDHLSCYLLTVDEKVPMGRDVARGRLVLPPDDDLADMYAITRSRLADGRVRAVRGLQLGAARPRVTPQPDVLAQWRMDRHRRRRGFDVWRSTLEEHAGARALHRLGHDDRPRGVRRGRDARSAHAHPRLPHAGSQASTMGSRAPSSRGASASICCSCSATPAPGCVRWACWSRMRIGCALPNNTSWCSTRSCRASSRRCRTTRGARRALHTASPDSPRLARAARPPSDAASAVW